MKKFLATVLLIIIAIGITACGGSGTKNETETETGEIIPVEDRGLELIAKLRQIASDPEYRDAVFPSGDPARLAEEIGKYDYSDPSSIYKLSYSSSFANMICDINPDMSETAREEMIKNIYSSIQNIFNVDKGPSFMAVGGSMTARDTIVDKQITETISYLYFYKEGYAIFVTFIPGQDDSVSESAGFVYFTEDDKDNYLNLMKVMGIKIEQVK